MKSDNSYKQWLLDGSKRDKEKKSTPNPGSWGPRMNGQALNSMHAVRRAVYDRGFPSQLLLSAHARSAENTSFTDKATLKRVDEWLRRELQALLEQEDVSIVQHFVLGIVAELGLHSQHTIEELRPFLFDKTELFLHELEAFARSPYDMATWDRLVRYPLASSPTLDILPGSARKQSSSSTMPSDRFDIRTISANSISISHRPPPSLSQQPPQSHPPGSSMAPIIIPSDPSPSRSTSPPPHSHPTQRPNEESSLKPQPSTHHHPPRPSPEQSTSTSTHEYMFPLLSDSSSSLKHVPRKVDRRPRSHSRSSQHTRTSPPSNDTPASPSHPHPPPLDKRPLSSIPHRHGSISSPPHPHNLHRSLSDERSDSRKQRSLQTSSAPLCKSGVRNNNDGISPYHPSVRSTTSSSSSSSSSSPQSSSVSNMQNLEGHITAPGPYPSVGTSSEVGSNDQKRGSRSSRGPDKLFVSDDERRHKRISDLENELAFVERELRRAKKQYRTTFSKAPSCEPS